MIKRPTEIWREQIDVEAEMLGSGELDPEDAFRAKLMPPALLSRADELFDSFEQTAARLVSPTDHEVLAVLENVTRSLNVIDRDFHDPFETPERDQLCWYVEAVITVAGIDLDALARRCGIERSDLLDEWREW